MLILARDRAKEPERGYAKTFLRQLEDCLGLALDSGVKIVANAGGLNPAGLAAAVRALAERLGLDANVAHVEGDDLSAAPANSGSARPWPPTPTSARGASSTASTPGRRRRHRPGHRRLGDRRPGRRALRLGSAPTTTRSPARSWPGTSSSAAPRPPAATTRSSPRSPTSPSRLPDRRDRRRRIVRDHQARRHRRPGQRRHRHRAAALRDRRRALREPGRDAADRHHRAQRRRPRPGADQRRARRSAPADAQGVAEQHRRVPQRGDVRAHRPRHRGQGRTGRRSSRRA